jgi:hypothetical protein
MLDEKLKEIDEFLESISKKFNSIKAALMINVFEKEYEILSEYTRGRNSMSEGRFVAFEFQKDVFEKFWQKKFVVFEVNPKERVKIYPWIYNDVDLPKVYDCVFSLSSEENLGLVGFMFKKTTDNR